MDVRHRILHAAAELYAETGFRGATTRRIAERAGVNEITLFRQFGSKTRLLHEAIKCAGAATESLGLPDPAVDPRSELAQWAGATHRTLFARRSLIRTAMGEIEERPDILPREQSPTMCAGHALGGYLGRLQAHGRIRADLDLHAAVTMLLGTLFADAMGRDLMPEMYRSDPDTTVRRYVDLFARAIGLEGGVG